MKKLIILLLLCTSIIFGAINQTTVNQLTGQAQTLDNVTLNSTVTEAKTSNEVANFIQENNSVNNKLTTETTKEEIKNSDIEIEKTLKNQSIYTQYLSEIMKKNKEVKLFGIDLINNSKDKEVMGSISKDYILGTGDIISIKIWSELYVGTETDVNQVLPMEISKNGTIFVPNVGSFFVNGKSIKTIEKELLTEARKKVKYFNAEINLEKTREISVFVVGEVNTPGNITTTAYANIMNILNKSRGVTEKASLRNIKIIREGQDISIDLYPYLLGGGNIDELKLKDGDTIYIPVAEKVVLIEGAVNRPAYYEIGKEKDYKSLINFAGGFVQLASKEKIEIYTVNGSSIKMETAEPESAISNNIFKINVNKIDENNRNDVYILGAVINPNVYSFEKGMLFSELLKKSGGYIKESTQNFVTIIRGKEKRKIINFNPKTEDLKLEIGDEIYVYNYNDINNKSYASVTGAVLSQGNYEIYEGSKILNLLYSARGLDESKNPYMNRADLYRIEANGRLRVYKIDLTKLLEGNDIENILIRRNDTLKIYSYDDVVKYDEIFIYGEVREPGKYRYYENMSLEDLVFYAKGLQNKADSNIVVNRNEGQNIKEYIIDLSRNPDFKIIEGDLIFVRKKSDWIDSKIVKLGGFVKYPGSYQLNKNETMDSLIKRAGGFISGAFPEGVQFGRKKEILVEDKETKTTKIVEEFEKITNFEFDGKNNNYVRDIELIDGDTIYIPEKPTTVKVEGEVYSPSYIVYDKKMDNYKEYVAAAGGYKETAYKKRVFIIKANGKTYDKPGDTKIEPGDTIYVPLDAREKKGIDRAIELFKGTLEIVSTVALIVVMF